jgi:hypothetical protein
LAKSKPEFNLVIQRFRAVQLPEHAARYAKLEERLILYKLEKFLGEVEAARAFKDYVTS